MDPAAEVWITGASASTPLGHTPDEVGRNLLAGRSGIRRISGIDTTAQACQIGGQIDAIPCPPGEDPADFAALGRLEQLVRYCCIQALRDAGLWETRRERRPKKGRTPWLQYDCRGKELQSPHKRPPPGISPVGPPPWQPCPAFLRVDRGSSHIHQERTRKP